ncbi:hypothetical protein [Siphonobacter aquaeclarae]|uniref:Uncharacterized protein n=1 Tax=Siphonobacter aquaeclarae TaxID=563176 RepID=A0A1G9YC05_9BACT|nr:hypothetical protein [Siphonobacter aquaeclarae]SDN05943.1 hypothetical protein SAMN04488090_4877 [Siphonobacter aquaeclarae]
MNLDDLKSGWQQASDPKKEETLRQMMVTHPSVRRIRIKLLIEVLAMAVLLALYYDAFDGAQKPLYANVLLVVSALCYLLTDLAGLFVLALPDAGTGLRESLVRYLTSLRRFSLLAQGAAIAYAAGLLVFFASVVPPEKYGFLALAGGLLLVPFYFSARQWQGHLKQVQATLLSFGE